MKPLQSPYRVHVHVEFGPYANNWCTSNLDNDEWLCYDYTSEYYHTYAFTTSEQAIALVNSISNINRDYVIYDEKT